MGPDLEGHRGNPEKKGPVLGNENMMNSLELRLTSHPEEKVNRGHRGARSEGRGFDRRELGEV